MQLWIAFNVTYTTALGVASGSRDIDVDSKAGGPFEMGEAHFLNCPGPSSAHIGMDKRPLVVSQTQYEGEENKIYC